MDLLSKKYRQAKEISNLKAEIDRLNRCLMESLTHEKNALDVSVKYKEALQEIKVICDYENEYNSIGIDDYKKIIRDIVNLIAKMEVK